VLLQIIGIVVSITLTIIMQELAKKRKKHSLLTLGIFALIACFTVFKLIGYLYYLTLSSHYSSYIPKSFEIDKTIFAEDKIGGFIEGCGVGIFKLSENTSANISRGGIVFLNNNSTITDSKRKKYARWQETPFVFERGEYCVFDRVVGEDAGGNTCADIPKSLQENIFLALNNPGTFRSGFNKNTEIIVIPNLRLVIFSHDR
jgi:hypothetical protein